MSPKRVIYPIFLPHAGCPFQCVYCNQRAVASHGHGGSDILEFVDHGLKTYSDQIQKSGRSGEIAFFGGTFSALPAALMEYILDAASVHVRRGIFTGIRFSTRPDCLGGKVMDLLSKYPIRTVELGVQSLSDAVLQKSGRGYCARSVHDAARRVKDKGWDLGVQLMAGLPGEDEELFMGSMREAIRISPHFFRIYPTLVLEGTALADWFRKGVYAPLDLEKAVAWLAPAYDLATAAGIPVIRMGLQPDPALEKPGVILAGPYHPAFGCLVKSRWWRDRVDQHFASSPELFGGEVVLLVASNQVSDATGHGRSNLRHWEARWNINARVVGAAWLTGSEMIIKTGCKPRPDGQF